MKLKSCLSLNRVWKSRLCDVGIVVYSQALDYAFSGVMLRASGFSYDVRKLFP